MIRLRTTVIALTPLLVLTACEWPFGENGSEDGPDVPGLGTAHRHFGANPAWGPEGEWIVFWHYGGEYGPRGFYRIHPDGTGRELLVAGAPPAAADWSPNGRYLVYARYDDHIYRLDLKTGEEVRLTEPGPNPYYPGWNNTPMYSPDGRTIAYASTVETSRRAYGLFYMDADGSDPRMILDDTAFGGQEINQLDWAPNGHFLVVEHSGGKLVVIRAEDGSLVRELARNVWLSYPRWSPTGEWIAYEDEGDLHLVTPDGTRDRVFPDVAMGSWSPDGTGLAVAALIPMPEGGPAPAIHILDLDTGELTLVTQPPP